MDELMKETFERKQQELLEQIEATKAENTELKEQLELTQAVLDEMLIGGTL